MRAGWAVPVAAVLVGVAGCGGAPGSAVQEAFQQRYPGSEVTAWEQQPYGWEASFGGDDGVYEAEFDPSGRWLESEVEVIDAAGFPAAVRQAVTAATGRQPIEKWEIEITPDGEFYEVEPAGSDAEYYVDATGRPAVNQYEDA